MRVGVGTDYVGFPITQGVHEFGIMVEVGRLADIIAVPGNPLGDLGVLEDVRLVMLGGQVIAPVLERCDVERVPAYLESSNPRNVPFYQRHGFQVVDEIVLEEGGPVLHTMWRDPR